MGRSVLVIFVFLLFSCDKKESPKNSELKERNVSLKKDFEEITEVGDKTINWVNFQEVYSFTDSEGFKQTLGINRLSSDTLEYQLASLGIMCDMELHGKAGRISQKEIKQSPRLEGSEDEVFTIENEDYLISIRIIDPKKTKAQFIYNPKEGKQDEECDPINEIVMNNVR
jgi:hypothetical protein